MEQQGNAVKHFANASRSFLSILVTMVVVAVIVLPAKSQEKTSCSVERMQQLTDEQLVIQLGSRNAEASFLAAKEIMCRGERMIPLLVANKENTEPFAWGNLGDPRSNGEIIFLPSQDPEFDEGRIVTVEVASLYLISAIFAGDLNFADSAYLKDELPVEFKRYNTRERVGKAWASVDAWLKEYEAGGLKPLRAKGHHPLRESGLHF